jgi:S-DNA-T family DNA segregation ATPase FtsK/SpoIIIE
MTGTSHKKGKKLSPKNASTEKSSGKRNQKGYLREEILSVIFFIIALFIYVCIRNFQGLPDDAQFIGFVGTYVMQGLEKVFGSAVFIVALYFLAWSIHLGVLKEIWSGRMLGVTLIAAAVLILVSLYNTPLGMDIWEAGLRGMGGGITGGILALALLKLFGRAGTALILALIIILGIMLVLDQPFSNILKYTRKYGGKLIRNISNLMFYEHDTNTADKTETPPLTDNIRKMEPVIINNASAAMEAVEPLEHSIKNDVPEIKPRPEAKKSLEIVYPVKDKKLDYKIPPLELLSEINTERTIDKKNIKESVSVLEDTFASFGIKVKVNQVSCGPSITRYELTPAPGVKVSRIISLADDLQLNLAAPGIRIEAPIPGKAAIGIEVPNSKIAGVGLKHILSSQSFARVNSVLAFALGEDIAGNPVVAKLSDMPHLLIAGSTGSGKSVCLNSIIMSLLYNSTPEQLRLVFIDPKMVELTIYNGIPHLMTPVVTDPRKASIVLRWMVTEMEKRYRAFAELGVRDIYKYNVTAKEKLPYIVIIIDELADLMTVSPVEVEDSICRLAQMARAAGMHLVVATQRPSVDVVTGIIKANIPSRIAFAVSSQADSRTIIDMGGAEKLLGKGDMLFFPVGAAKPFRVQGTFVSDSDIEQTVAFIIDQSVNKEEKDEFKEVEFSLQQAEELEEDDDLFWQGVQLFVDTQKASVSLLQRKLRVGYARAARLVDMMEERGIVSEMDNNKKREVLIDSNQLEKLMANHDLS